jgi:hypothetical protein
MVDEFGNRSSLRPELHLPQALPVLSIGWSALRDRDPVCGAEPGAILPRTRGRVGSVGRNRQRGVRGRQRWCWLVQFKLGRERPTGSLALGILDCDRASAQSGVRQHLGDCARRVRRRPAPGPWARSPGRTGCSDRSSPSRVGCRREAPSVLVDWNRASGPPPLGGMWARASDIARFESVGSCRLDRDGFGLTRSEEPAAVRSEWHEKEHELAVVRSCGRGAELPLGGDRVGG